MGGSELYVQGIWGKGGLGPESFTVEWAVCAGGLGVRVFLKVPAATEKGIFRRSLCKKKRKVLHGQKFYGNNTFRLLNIVGKKSFAFNG
jgi:hypothetical protein